MANLPREQRPRSANRKLISLRLAGALVLGILSVSAGIAAAATFSASLERDTVTLGDSVTLALNFEGGSPKAVPAIPSTPNLQITSAGQSSQFNLVNGQMSSTVTYNFSVTPRQVGEFTIPALVAEVNGQRLSSQPLKLTAVRNAPPPDAASAANQVAFLRLVLPKSEVYAGEIIVARCGSRHPAVQPSGAAGGRV